MDSATDVKWMYGRCESFPESSVGVAILLVPDALRRRSMGGAAKEQLSAAEKYQMCVITELIGNIRKT